MKYLKFIALVLCFLTWGAGAVEVGNPAPDFVLESPAGPVRLSDLRGKTVYLDFWASWCGPCRESFPWMNQMQTRYGGQGLYILGVNLDEDSQDAQSFLKSVPAKFSVAFDPAGKTPRQYGVRGMPTSVLIGPDGKVLWVHSGFRQGSGAELEEKIRVVLKNPS